MKRTFALIPAIALAGAVSALAQEASRPEPTHEKFTVAGEPNPVTFVADFVGRFVGDGSGEEKAARLGHLPQWNIPRDRGKFHWNG